MAKLGTEATTTRRVLESLFRYFDNGCLWSPKYGVASPVLKDMQEVMETFGKHHLSLDSLCKSFQDDRLTIALMEIFTGHSSHFLLSILIKHLDHKNVLKQPDMQLDIIEVTTTLAEQAEVEPSVALLGAISDVMRHLRKSIHSSLDDSNLGSEVIKYNRRFKQLVDDCLVQITQKVYFLTNHVHFLFMQSCR